MNQEVYFTDIRNQIIKHLKECNYDLKIAVAWFTDKIIISEINNLIDKGVTVSIIIYDDRINQKDFFEKLYYNRAQIYLSKKLMHNKFCIIDNKTIINGSYNWTLNAKSNNENIQISYDNFSLTEKFNNEFLKLCLNCTKIDDHFEYSFANIENIDYEFENYYDSWPNYKFPYFIDLVNFKPSKENSLTRIKGFVYLIKDRNEEERFIWYYFLLNSKYSLGKVLSVKKVKIILPIKFDFVHLDKLDKNNVSEFNSEFYTVEEHLNKYAPSSYRTYFIYSINKDGKPVNEKIRYTKKLTSDLYLREFGLYCGTGEKPFFIDKNFNKTIIKSRISKIIDGNTFIVSKYENSKSSYGLLNNKNEIILEPQFDDYNFRENNDYFDFIEYPILEINLDTNYVYETSYIKYQSSENESNVDLMFYRYSTKNLDLLEKFRFERKNKTVNKKYLFYSDSDYKYKKFYAFIKNFKFDSTKVKIASFLNVEEFNELQLNYSNISNLNILLNKYQNERIKAQILKEANIKKEKPKEGCYIATLVYQDYDHPKVKTLRLFRDEVLQKKYFGRSFIRFYYSFSPKFVELLRPYPFAQRLIRNFIDKIV